MPGTQASGGLSAAQLQQLALLTGTIAQAPGMPTLVARLAQGLAPLVDFDQLCLAMRSADGRTWALIRPRLATGGEPTWLELNDPESGLEEALREDRPTIVDRPRTHLLPPGLEASSPIVELSTFPSAACAPLRGPDGPLGALGCFSSRAQAFGATELALVQLVASLVESSARRLVLLDELARTERELRRTEKLRGDLTQSLAQDLAQPLASLKGSLDVLQGAVLPPDAHEAREIVEELRGTAGALADLVTNLSDIARLEEGQVSLKREPVLLDRFLRERVGAMQPLARSQEQALLVRAEPENARVSFDLNLVGRVVDALVLHALRHAPRGGQVAVVGRLSQRTLTIAVGDTGPAIPPEQRDRLFTKFGQHVGDSELVRPPRGLSLYFCKLAVELHGGRIAAEEPPAGVGALVRVTMPA